MGITGGEVPSGPRGEIKMKKSLLVLGFLSLMCLASQAKADGLTISYSTGYSYDYDYAPVPVYQPVRVVQPYYYYQPQVVYYTPYRQYPRYQPRFVEYRHHHSNHRHW